MHEGTQWSLKELMQVKNVMYSDVQGRVNEASKTQYFTTKQLG